MKFTPRDYQLEAVEASEKAEARAIRRQLIVLPTGSGKTCIFAMLIEKRKGRALVLAHRDELVRQAVDKIHMVAPNVDVGIVKAKSDEHDKPVVIASVQTLSRMARITRMFPDFNTVIIDEAHHGVSQTYQRVSDYCAAGLPGGPLLVGVTATPERGDKLSLQTFFEEVVYQKSMLEMIEAGYLCNIRALRVPLEMDLDSVRIQGGDFAAEELGTIMLKADAPKYIVDAIIQHGDGRRGLVFTPTVLTAEMIASELQSRGIAADWLSGSTPFPERLDILGRLKSGQTRIVCNCAVLTEGFDESSIDLIVMARPTRSRSFFVQCVGRGTRLHPGKTDCLVLDVSGATERHKIQNVARMVGIHELPETSTVLDEVEKEKRKGDRDLSRISAYETDDMRTRPIELFASRQLKWFPIGDAWALPLQRNHSVVKIVPYESGDCWTVQVEFAKEGMTQELASNVTLGFAQGIAEDYAREQGVDVLLKKKARWRHYPATGKQVKWLSSLGVEFEASITRGEASDLITMSKLKASG